MHAERIALATSCLDGAHDGSLSFPTIVDALMHAGFDGYMVDYRRNVSIYYLPDGDSVTLDMLPFAGKVAIHFDAAAIEACVREAQAGKSDYTYKRFSETVKEHGCAGYMVSFPGRRVLYFGRTAETHVEHFPQ